MLPADSPFASLLVPGPHPELAALRAYAAGTLPPARRHSIEVHTLACARCADVLAGLAMTDTATTDQAVADLRARLQARVGQEAPARPGLLVGARPAWRWPRLAAAAALLVGALGAGVWGWEKAGKSAPTAHATVELAPPATGQTNTGTDKIAAVAPASAPAAQAADAAVAPNASVASEAAAGAPAPAAPADYAAVVRANQAAPKPPLVPPVLARARQGAVPRPPVLRPPTSPPGTSAEGFEASRSTAPQAVAETGAEVADGLVSRESVRPAAEAAPAAVVLADEQLPAAAPTRAAEAAVVSGRLAKANSKSRASAATASATASAPVAAAQSEPLRVAADRADTVPSQALRDLSAGSAPRTRAALPPPPTLEPMPRGGYRALRIYLQKKAADFVPEAGQSAIRGLVRVRFTVSAAGQAELTQARVLQSLRPDYDAEVLRILAEWPAWVPGVAGGRRAPLPIQIEVLF